MLLKSSKISHLTLVNCPEELGSVGYIFSQSRFFLFLFSSWPLKPYFVSLFCVPWDFLFKLQPHIPWSWWILHIPGICRRLQNKITHPGDIFTARTTRAQLQLETRNVWNESNRKILKAIISSEHPPIPRKWSRSILLFFFIVVVSLMQFSLRGWKLVPDFIIYLCKIRAEEKLGPVDRDDM